MTKMRTPNYGIGTGDGMEGRRVAVRLDGSVALGGGKGWTEYFFKDGARQNGWPGPAPDSLSTMIYIFT
jgi:hypothetical protein